MFDFLRLKGAGKSTAIRILLGLLKSTDGRAWVLGHPATERKNEHRFGTMLPAKWMAVNHLQKRKPTAL
ncbi:hypothetical protein ACFFQF_04880 [Haladaptatus pallidirubidus]|uniref:hypothetical protein n=1 Tax=Haladaptatus pallidirubidus TaxID=1008152 RepID=UPI0035EA5805